MGQGRNSILIYWTKDTVVQPIEQILFKRLGGYLLLWYYNLYCNIFPYFIVLEYLLLGLDPNRVLCYCRMYSLLVALKKLSLLPCRVTVFSFGLLAGPVSGICTVVFEVSQLNIYQGVPEHCTLNKLLNSTLCNPPNNSFNSSILK